LLATLISQIIMFNVLIAILGDTYNRIMEKKIHHGIKAKTEMYADMIYQFKWFGFNKFLQQRYLYVMRPMDDDDCDEWEGAVGSIKNKIEKVKISVND